MYPYGAARGNLDLTGKIPVRTGPYHPGSDLAGSMDLPGHDYGPYRGPARHDQYPGRADPQHNAEFHDDRHYRGRGPDQHEPQQGTTKYFLRKFAERTSLQGVPYIYLVRKTYRRILWSLLFIIMTLATLIHLGLLTYKFLQFETSSSINLKRTNLDFPSVTLCNLNPVLFTHLDNTSSEVYAIQQGLDPGRRKKRQTETGQTVDAGYLGDLTNVALLDEDNLEFDDDGEFSDDEIWGAGEVDPESRIYSSFYYYIGLLPKQKRLEIGHSEHLIIRCTFNGRTCSTSDFAQSLSREHGNCYTFNSKELASKSQSFKSIKSGYNLGLQLVLFTQDNEYLKGMTIAKGVKVTPHAFGTMPNLDNGLALSPGFETYIGMKMKQITRLTSPYGECGDDDEFEKRFNNQYSYTLEACLNACKHQLIIEKCGCYQGEYIEYYTEEEIDNAITGLCDTQEEFNCTNAISDTDNPCGCNQGCSETRYDTDLSMNGWPDVDKWDDLSTEVCERFGNTSSTCLALTNESDSEYALRKNFMKLNIYYEDLTYEIIKEAATYDGVQFASDIGGVFGLWIGASILSLCEVIDLFLSICMACCRSDRDSYGRRRRRRPQYITEYDGDGYRGNPRSGFGGKRGPADAEWGRPPPF